MFVSHQADNLHKSGGLLRTWLKQLLTTCCVWHIKLNSSSGEFLKMKIKINKFKKILLLLLFEVGFQFLKTKNLHNGV